MGDNIKSQMINEVCQAVEWGHLNSASSLIQNRYPFERVEYQNRSFTPLAATKIFIRDGFIDHYSGHQLIFPPVLRVLSKLFPTEFPFHPNWKMNECHIAYWELVPTIDHITPIARGGTNVASNWVCTSMLRNGAKSNWTLEELNWQLHPPGDFEQWDGLLHWFTKYFSENEELNSEAYFRRWYSVALRALEELA